MWVLGTALGSSGRAGNTLKHEAISPAPFGQCFITSTEKHLNIIHEAISAGGYGNESSVEVLVIPGPVFHKILKARQINILGICGTHGFLASIQVIWVTEPA